MNEFQEWCKEILPVVQAAAEGREIQYQFRDTWLDMDSGDFCDGAEYRIKPRTIKIGEYDVPEPVREPLKDGETFWIAWLSHWEKTAVLTWDGSEFVNMVLARGLMHLTKEAAEIHTKALISLTEK